jgi:hypothetical protein
VFEPGENLLDENRIYLGLGAVVVNILNLDEAKCTALKNKGMIYRMD